MSTSYPHPANAWVIAAAALAAASVAGCAPAAELAQDSSSSEAHESSGSASDPSTSSSSSSAPQPSTGTDDGSSSGESSSGSAPFCGDGHLDPGEACDNGNVGEGGCEADCTLTDLDGWSYLGGPLTSVRALAIGAEGEIVAGGSFGNAWAFESTAMLRVFDAGGVLLEESDALVPGDAAVLSIAQHPDGRFWLFGARGENAWIFRFDDDGSDQVNLGELDGFTSAGFGADGVAASSFADVAMLDPVTGRVVWEQPIGSVDDAALAPNGDILVVGRPMYGDPFELLRFAADGSEAAPPIPLGAAESCSIGTSALGSAVVCMVDPSTLASQLRLFDDDGEVQWSVDLPDARFFAVTANDTSFVLSGGILGDGSLTTAAFGFAADGSELWMFAPDPAEHGLQGGLFTNAVFAADGSIVFGGALYDLAADPFEPPAHAFIVRHEP